MNFLNKAIEMYSRKSYCIFRALYYFLSLVSTQFKVQSVLSYGFSRIPGFDKKWILLNHSITAFGLHFSCIYKMSQVIY